MSRVSPEVGARLGCDCGNHVAIIENSGELAWFHSKMRGFWRQVTWGHLSKQAKCVTNSSWELQPGPTELSAACRWRRLCVCCVCCPYPLGNIQWKGQAQPWGLGGPWYKLQTSHVKARPEHDYPSPIHCAQFLHPIPGLQAGGTSWYGLARDDEEGTLLRGCLDGDLGKGVPQSVTYWPWYSSLPFTGLVGSWGAQGSEGKSPTRGDCWGGLVHLPEQCNKRGAEHCKQKVSFSSSFL